MGLPLRRGDPRVPFRGRKESFTLNGASSNPRAHSNQPFSHFFFALPSVCFFFSSYRLRAEQEVCKAIFNPFFTIHQFLLLLFFFFCSSSRSIHADFFVFPPNSFLPLPRPNYAGFSYGNTGRKGRGRLK